MYFYDPVDVWERIILLIEMICMSREDWELSSVQCLVAMHARDHITLSF